MSHMSCLPPFVQISELQQLLRDKTEEHQRLLKANQKLRVRRTVLESAFQAQAEHMAVLKQMERLNVQEPVVMLMPTKQRSTELLRHRSGDDDKVAESANNVTSDTSASTDTATSVTAADDIRPAAGSLLALVQEASKPNFATHGSSGHGSEFIRLDSMNTSDQCHSSGINSAEEAADTSGMLTSSNDSDPHAQLIPMQLAVSIYVQYVRQASTLLLDIDDNGVLRPKARQKVIELTRNCPVVVGQFTALTMRQGLAMACSNLETGEVACVGDEHWLLAGEMIGFDEGQWQHLVSGHKLWGDAGGVHGGC